MKIAESKERIADTRKMINKTDGSNLFDTLIEPIFGITTRAKAIV